MLGWIGGQGAIEMEKLSNKEIADVCIELIRKFMNNPKLPNPSKFYCSRWNSHKLIKGAYSFTSKNTDKIDEWEKILSRVITSNDGDNRMLLAGEHCHEQYFSTVHGAFLSGIEQAEKIIKLQRRNVSIVSKL